MYCADAQLRLDFDATQAYAKGYLLTIARIGVSNNYVGTDVVGDYFKRNVRIYANLLRQVEVRRDKSIVLIIGAGHASLLKSILLPNSLFKVVGVLPLLEAKN